MNKRTRGHRKHAKRVMRDCDYMCVYCGGDDYLTIDHIIPLKLGGNDEFENLTVACRSCNSKKNARLSIDLQKQVEERIIVEDSEEVGELKAIIEGYELVTPILLDQLEVKNRQIDSYLDLI